MTTGDSLHGRSVYFFIKNCFSFFLFHKPSLVFSKEVMGDAQCAVPSYFWCKQHWAECLSCEVWLLLSSEIHRSWGWLRWGCWFSVWFLWKVVDGLCLSTYSPGFSAGTGITALHLDQLGSFPGLGQRCLPATDFPEVLLRSFLRFSFRNQANISAEYVGVFLFVLFLIPFHCAHWVLESRIHHNCKGIRIYLFKQLDTGIILSQF